MSDNIVICYTDDECHVPVRFNLKIFIGPFTAELTAYDDSVCKVGILK